MRMAITRTPHFGYRTFEGWNNRRTRNHLAKFNPNKNDKLLEVGVGSGLFLNYMRSKGLNVAGCDLSKTICKRVESTFGIPMHNGSVSDLPLTNQYNMIAMNHVLEHVNNPIAFLKEVRARLNSRGLLHIAVPNVVSWEAGLSGWAGYEQYHLLYFSPKTLKMAVEKAGFRVIKLATHESFSGWFLAFLRTALKTNRNSASERHSKRQARKSSPIDHMYSLAMVASGGFSFPLRYIQGRLKYGDEIVVVAQPDGTSKKHENES